MLLVLAVGEQPRTSQWAVTHSLLDTTTLHPTARSRGLSYCLPLKHSAVDSHSRLRIAYHRIVRPYSPHFLQRLKLIVFLPHTYASIASPSM